MKKGIAGLIGAAGIANVNQDENPRPNEKGSRSKLPNKGKHKYRAPKEKGKNQDTNIKKSSDGEGYVDELGNTWKWDVKGKHWDVQHKNGSHTNVKSNGEIHHGKNNF